MPRKLRKGGKSRRRNLLERTLPEDHNLDNLTKFLGTERDFWTSEEQPELLESNIKRVDSEYYNNFIKRLENFTTHGYSPERAGPRPELGANDQDTIDLTKVKFEPIVKVNSRITTESLNQTIVDANYEQKLAAIENLGKENNKQLKRLLSVCETEYRDIIAGPSTSKVESNLNNEPFSQRWWKIRNRMIKNKYQ